MELFIDNPFSAFVATVTFIVIMVKGLEEGIATMYVLFAFGIAIITLGVQVLISEVFVSIIAGMILKAFFNEGKLQ